MLWPLCGDQPPAFSPRFRLRDGKETRLQHVYPARDAGLFVGTKGFFNDGSQCYDQQHAVTEIVPRCLDFVTPVIPKDDNSLYIGISDRAVA